MRSFAKLLVGALVAAAPSLVASSALAAAVCHTADGDVVISNTSSCEFRVSGGCEAECTPINMTAQCGAKCSGECKASATAECKGSCDADCKGKCEVDPGSFSCQGSCEADCSADCSGSCSAAANRAECEGTCKSSCSGQCNGECEGTPPEADCNVKCEASCEGSCHAEANVDCNVECSGSCTAEVSGGCKAACSKPEGALFCDGKFVAIDKITDCSFELHAHAEGHAEASCAAAPVGSTPFNTEAAAALVAGLGLIAARRRRNKS